MGSNIMRSH